jgi:hypothetical protein
MANTLTGLIPDLYAAMNVVSRELVGFIPAVMRDGTFERAALGQKVTSHVAPAANGSDISPAMAIPEPTDQTIGTVQLEITKARMYEFGYVGEEQRGLNNNGAGYLSVQAEQIAEAMRAIANEIEADLSAEVYANLSRAYGTAGTTPFASTLADSAQVRKIMDDNGSPLTDRGLIISTSTGANLRTLGQLTKANEASDSTMLRQGNLLDLHGFAFRETAQAVSHTKGAGTGYLMNNAAAAVGDTSVPIDTGSGTVLAGDVVTFAGDSNKYVVSTGVAAPGTIVLNAPGLLVAVANNAAMTIGDSYEANCAFSRSAVQLAVRAPALPEEGDLADDRMPIQDPRSGLVFEVSVYRGYRKVRYEVAAAWGQKMVKPAHGALLLG